MWWAGLLVSMVRTVEGLSKSVTQDSIKVVFLRRLLTAQPKGE